MVSMRTWYRVMCQKPYMRTPPYELFFVKMIRCRNKLRALDFNSIIILPQRINFVK